MRRKRRQLWLAAAGVGAAGMSAPWVVTPARAATRTWTGAGTTINWSEGANWGGTSPTNGDNVVFSGNTKLTNFNDISGLSLAGGTIAVNAGSFDLTGNAITLTGDFNQLSTNAQTIDLNVVLPNTRVFQTQGNTNGTLTFNGVISGAGGFTKSNGGVASIIFTNANTYAGATSIQANNPGALILNGLGSSTNSVSWTPAGGTLLLDNSGTNVNDRMGDTASVNLQASQFTLIGNASAGTAEKTGALTVSGPNPLSIITLDARAGGAAALTFTSGTVQTSTGLLVRGPNLGTPAAGGVGQLFFTTTPRTSGTGAAGSISVPVLTGVIVDNSITGVGTDFAAYDATNGLRPLTASEYAPDFATPGVNNVKLAAAPAALAGNASVNSLLLSGGAYSADLGGNTLSVVSGNVLSDGTSAATRTIANGTLTFTTSANGARVFNNGGTLDLAVGQINNGGAPLTFMGTGTTTVEAKISGGGGLNAVNVGGRVILNATSDYTGATAISSDGMLQFSVLRAAANNALGTNTVTISPGGQIELTGGITLPNAFLTTGAGPSSQGVIRSLSGTNTIVGTVTMMGGAGSSNYQSDAGSLLVFSGSVTANTTTRVAFVQGAGDGLISGRIVDGTGANTLGGVAKSGTGTWTLSGTNNAYSGTTTINGGTLVAIDGASLPNGSAANGGKSGNLRIASGNLATSGVFTRAVGTGTNQVQITGGTSGFGARGGSAIVDLGGTGVGDGPTLVWGSSTFAPSILLLNDTSADSLLDFRSSIELNGTNTSLTRFVNVNAPTARAVISGAITNGGTGLANLTKAGVGTLVIAGNAQYNGNLTVNAGTVLVTGKVGATATNVVTVATGSTFGGTGDGSNTGVVTSGVVVNNSAGATFSPGMNGSNAASASAGALTVGTLTFSGSNATFLVDLVASSGSGAASLAGAGLNYDSVTLSRTNAAAGTGVNLALNDGEYERQLGDQFFIVRGAAGGNNNTLTLRFAGSTLAENAQFDADSSGLAYRINYNAVDPVTGGKDVVLTVVPEPTSLGVMALGAVAMLGRRRRRARS